MVSTEKPQGAEIGLLARLKKTNEFLKELNTSIDISRKIVTGVAVLVTGVFALVQVQAKKTDKSGTEAHVEKISRTSAASSSGNPKSIVFSEESVSQKCERLKKLIENGYDVNKQDREGNTILHYVAHGGTKAQKPIVEMLKQKGARIDLKDMNDMTAYAYAKEHKKPIYSVFQDLYPQGK